MRSKISALACVIATSAFACSDDGAVGGLAASDAMDAAATTDAADAGATPPMPGSDASIDASSPDASPPDAAPPMFRTDYAPYFFTWEWGGGGKFSSLVDLYDNHHLTGATIAFVLADSGQCRATTDVMDHLADARAFMMRGGQLKASFGGADGDYLDYICTDVASFAKALEDFVDATGITDLDFDIEQGSKSFNTTVNARRGDALKKAQVDRNVKVSFTLPAAPSSGDGSGGLVDEGLGLLRAVIASGVAISHVNLMLMDYGSEWQNKPLAPPSIGALVDAHAQLRTLISGLSDVDAWRMLGATPMIGENDDGAIFSLADAQSLATFAKQKTIGLVSFWGINRDFPCTSGLNTCSTVNVHDFDFNEILRTVH